MPAPTIAWQKIPTDEHRVELPKCSLSVRDSSSWERRLSETDVHFLELDKEFPVSPASTTASIGERLRLRCEPPHGSPTPVVYWTKDGKNLSTPLDRHDLILPSVQASDFGAYRCIASNGVVRHSPMAHLTEFQRPKIHIRPSSTRVDVHRGKAVDFQCQVESVNDDDQYQIEWHYESQNGGIIGRNNRFEIPSVQFNQSGIYVCVVTYNSGRRRHFFSEQVLLAVHERLPSSNGEKLVSQSQANVYAGRPALLDCQLPLNLAETIIWSIVNRTDVSLTNSNRFEYVDKNQYRLKIRCVEELDNDLLFECYYRNKKSLSQGLIRLQVGRLESPPIIVHVPNNQTVPIGVEVILPCQTKETSKIQWWFTSSARPFKSIKVENSKKYRIESNHDLIIRHVEK